MIKLTCNIDRTDRINRSIFGMVLVFAGIFGAGKWFYILFGLILIVEGVIGWCSIPYVFSWFRATGKNKQKD